MTGDFKIQTVEKVRNLVKAYEGGILGGEVMPEDANPGLERECAENYLYFSLPMALNYQRDSYKLWESALLTYKDADTHSIFSPQEVAAMDENTLREKLLKHKLALQPNRHAQIWRCLCETLNDDWNGDIRNLFQENDNDVLKIKQYIVSNKKKYPYLSGPKIMNYWLYVMGNYTNLKLKNTRAISIAPDTHVIQATKRLGLIQNMDIEDQKLRETVAALWEEMLLDTEFSPIDIHTPLWLWSRGEFKFDVEKD